MSTEPIVGLGNIRSIAEDVTAVRVSAVKFLEAARNVLFDAQDKGIEIELIRLMPKPAVRLRIPVEADNETPR